MSGIEVAGLVLGAFPLLVTALEQYRESAEVYTDWWRFRRQYSKVKRDVEYHQITFSSNLEELLLPLVCEDEEIFNLMANPGGPAWQDSELESRLRERLPVAYDNYLASIHEISMIMEKLTQELGLDKAYMGTKTNKSDSQDDQKLERLSTTQALDYQFQRIKFALGRSHREKLFEEFSKYNDRLRDLLKTGDKISSLRKNRNSKDRSTTVASQFWRHAATIYRLLTKAWRCKCKKSHQANLRLQHRTASDIEFNIMFLFSMIHGEEKPWTCRDTKIKALKRPKVTPSPTPNFHHDPAVAIPRSLSSSAKSSMIVQQKTSILRKFRKSVSTQGSSFSSTTTLVTSPLPSSSVSVTWDESVPADASPSEKPEDHDEIHDLCEVLCKSKEASNCLGVLRQEESFYAVHPATEQFNTHESVSLKELLDQSSQVRLTRRQRYSIALALASSQVQLQSTPWLGSKWDKQQIVFFGHTSKPKTMLFDQPRLSREFDHHKLSETEPENDRSITTLGILLLELCFGITLQNSVLRQKYPVVEGPSSHFLDLAAALEWSEQVLEEAGPEFAGAVSWCLKSNASSATSDEWRAELLEHVVKPLQQCHEHLL